MDRASSERGPQDAAASLPQDPIEPDPLGEPLRLFDQHLIACKYSEGHRTRTLAMIRRVFAACHWGDLTAMNAPGMMAYLTPLVAASKIRAKTADNITGQLCTFAEFCRKRKWITARPFADADKFDRHPEDRGDGSRPATTEEIRAVVAQALADESRRKPRFDAHRSTLYVFLSHTALRVGSAFALAWSDSRLDDPFPHFVLPPGIEKTRRKRDVPLTTELAAKLIARRALLKPAPADRVFPFVHDRVLKGDVEDAGVGKVTAAGPFGFNSFKKWAASEMADAGVEIGVASQVLGHSNPRTTEKHYTRRRLKTVAGAVAQLPTLNGVMQNLRDFEDKSIDKPARADHTCPVRLADTQCNTTTAEPVREVVRQAASLTSPVEASASHGLAGGLSSEQLSRSGSLQIAGAGFEPAPGLSGAEGGRSACLRIVSQALGIVESLLRQQEVPDDRATAS